MKRLFHETYETYTAEAVEISQKIGKEIRKMIDHYCNDNGYSMNDIQQILHDEVTLNISEQKIIRNIKFKKEQRMKYKTYNLKAFKYGSEDNFDYVKIKAKDFDHLCLIAEDFCRKSGQYKSWIFLGVVDEF